MNLDALLGHWYWSSLRLYYLWLTHRQRGSGKSSTRINAQSTLSKKQDANNIRDILIAR